MVIYLILKMITNDCIFQNKLIVIDQKHNKKFLFDYVNHKLHIDKINFIEEKEVGSSNYSYDIIVTIELILSILNNYNDKVEDLSANVFIDFGIWFSPTSLVIQQIENDLKSINILDKIVNIDGKDYLLKIIFEKGSLFLNFENFEGHII